jgi:hypothetical protein
MGCFVRMPSILESFYSSNAHAKFFYWALQLMYVYDELLIVISTSGMVAMLLGIKYSSPTKLVPGTPPTLITRKPSSLGSSLSWADCVRIPIAAKL